MSNTNRDCKTSYYYQLESKLINSMSMIPFQIFKSSLDIRRGLNDVKNAVREKKLGKSKPKKKKFNIGKPPSPPAKNEIGQR